MKVFLTAIGSVLLFSSLSHANTFAEDLAFLKTATQLGNIATPELERYLDPRKGALEFHLNEKNAPWAGNYFPMVKGGIAQRWQDTGASDKLLSLDDVKKLTPEQLQKLSAIEKYDLYVGHADWEATLLEARQRGPMRELPLQKWEGFCNGVRCAGILLPEPKFAVEVLSPFGFKIEFQPADLKALAGASYFYVEKYAALGAPTKGQGRLSTPPNAAVFDLALRYNLAKKRKTFVIDASTTSEIWNETVIGYERKLGAEEALSDKEQEIYGPKKAVKKMRVDLDLQTLGEMAIAASNGPTKQKVASGETDRLLKTAYTLYLDASGRAVDGVWHKSEMDHRGVDFAWFAAGRGADAKLNQRNGNKHLSFTRIRALFKQSVHPSCRKLFF